MYNSRGCDMIIQTDWQRLFHGFVSTWIAPSAHWGVKSRWQTSRLNAHIDYVTAANHMSSVPDRTPRALRYLCQSFWLHCGLNKYNNPVVAMKNLCVYVFVCVNVWLVTKREWVCDCESMRENKGDSNMELLREYFSSQLPESPVQSTGLLSWSQTTCSM